jgi:hypothetical protein
MTDSFAGDLGRVTLWPFAMSASRAKASYRQQNNLVQWVGISGENASSDTNRAPTAVPVQETLTAGVAKTIDVIARAYDPDGDALSIQSGSLSPSTGTASIVSGQISWTAASSFTGAAECGFTLRDGGGKTSPARVYAQVEATPTTASELPASWPARTVWASQAGSGTGSGANASNRKTLASALADAAPGDYIRLAAGNYSGGYTLAANKTGTAALPIVVGVDGAVGGGTCDLSSIGAARFLGGFSLLGPHGYLWGTFHDGQLATSVGGIRLAGTRSRMQRVRIARWRTTATAGAGVNFVDMNGPGNSQGIYFCAADDYDGVPFLCDNQGTGRGDRIHFFRTYFHDNVPEAAGSAGNARESIGLGRTQVGSTPAGQRVNNVVGAAVVECLFRNLYNPGPSFDESEEISNKSSGNKFIRLSFDNCAKFLTIRFGNDCEVIGCRRSGGGGIIVYGDRHRLISNVSRIRVFSGTQTMDTGTSQVHPNGPTAPDAGNTNAYTPWGGKAEPDKADEPVARSPFLSGNNGTLDLGEMPRSHAILRVTGAIIEQHTGTINTERTYTNWGGRAHSAQGSNAHREYGSVYRANATVALPGTPALLTPAQVGPTAPWLTPVTE